MEAPPRLRYVLMSSAESGSRGRLKGGTVAELAGGGVALFHVMMKERGRPRHPSVRRSPHLTVLSPARSVSTSPPISSTLNRSEHAHSLRQPMAVLRATGSPNVGGGHRGAPSR